MKEQSITQNVGKFKISASVASIKSVSLITLNGRWGTDKIPSLSINNSFEKKVLQVFLP